MRLQLKLLVTHTALPNPTHSGVGNVPDLSPSCCREACTYGLAYLDKHAPDLAIMLRHVWTCASPGARYGQKAAITLARYIKVQWPITKSGHFVPKATGALAGLVRTFFWQPQLAHSLTP